MSEQRREFSPQIDADRDRFRFYACRYYHDCSWWGLNISARDQADAEARVRKLGNLQLLGEIHAIIPAGIPGAGLFARALVWIRNHIKPQTSNVGPSS
jgi:hypothetical protein